MLLRPSLGTGTGCADQREKWYAYALIQALKVYVLVSQNKCEVTVLRRGRRGPWIPQVLNDPGAGLKLSEIQVDIPLTRIYERTAVLRQKVSKR